ncbi:tRNA (adenosine(37)-N6)-dimethylallyltransferase MiaA [Cryobacterium tepidiphilum]|uniref:tRNA dimethylallyltransferase n=1 Tax=Cryobacterium tepidiphilum TaxID=2486026 RepID=A0A3M8LAN8_9MICO|nr:tRNA (adenosine(37)-N6)-dimethylallyltransferase MiaA [Cryobacterium tepidiphilum]RNE62506.1 tRNA (adenosine(37)-N6)-dimethylallyltransferase MiaA [Cryobacterium tepidiphilum]
MLVVIVGPTGTGKSDLSLDVATRLREAGRAAEIVNADAMQLYRGMDIGTAKVPLQHRRGVPHHMLDVLEVQDEATVARYQPQARAAIEDIRGRGAVPILVGGSGLYVSSVIYDFRFPGTDSAVRARLEADLKRRGPGELYRTLASIDPVAADRIGASNGRRLVRALEVVEITGEPHAASLPDTPVPWTDTLTIGLRAPRDELTPRLDERVTRMWADGLVDEVARLVPLGIESGVTASRAIGYAQALGQLSGRLAEPDAITQTQQLTRRYARRQVSWFKRYPGAHWLDYQDPDRVDRALALMGGL